MTRGVSLYFVGSIVLVSLAGCGRGYFQAEREPWRAEAEVACLKSGAVKEGADIVRISPISGPGACGAEFPLKVSALGEASGSLGFADEEPRPPASIGNQPPWPVSQPQSVYPQRQPYPSSAGPLSLSPPGVVPQGNGINPPVDGADAAGSERYMDTQRYPARPYPPSSSPYSEQPLPRLGPARGGVIGAAGPVVLKPAATLACPIVSVLDRWIADSVQPAATRWFGQRVVEIKQISAYSCRGMNGNSNAHISEHAFGNALDVAAFVLADGRRITVKGGWNGLPEEQGFLRDVQAGACQQFTTVLAPGSNVYHYDHIHVDLMRRASRRLICQPAVASGEEIAARAQRRNPYASRDPSMTGSLGHTKTRPASQKPDEEDELMDD